MCQVVHFFANVAGFFEEFSLGCSRLLFVFVTRDITDQACWEIDDPFSDGYAKLFGENYPVIINDR